MTVYVDSLVEYPLGTVKGAERVKYWCHMFADSLPELMEMAQLIGMRPSWFQNHGSLPHFDLSQQRRNRALEAGAIERSALDFLREQRMKFQEEPKDYLKPL